MAVVELLPCRKCGQSDFDWWEGQGTQAWLYCKSCNQGEDIQVVDVLEYEERYSEDGAHDFIEETLSYPQIVIDKVNIELIKEWNKRFNPTEK